MSVSKKSTTPGDVAKSSSSKSAGSKRGVGEVHAGTGSVDMEDWSAMNRRVFATKGPGSLIDRGKEGVVNWCFTIIAYFADGKSAAVQAWKEKAPLFSQFFECNCKSDGGFSIWVIPVARDSGCFFRLKDPSSYVMQFLHVNYVLTADYGPKTKSPFPAITADDFPASYVWEDDTYALNGVPVPHFSLWATIATLPVSPPAPVAIDFTPRSRTFDQESPIKSKVPKLTASPSSSSSSGIRYASAMTAIDMDDNED